MSEEEFEKIMTANFENVFRGLLLSVFNSNSKVTGDYLAQPIGRQREIETEISTISRGMARSLVSRLKQGGFLTKEPPQEVLHTMIRQTMSDFGMKKP